MLLGNVLLDRVSNVGNVFRLLQLCCITVLLTRTIDRMQAA